METKIQEHFKEDLLKIPKEIYIHKRALPVGIDGIYQIYDMKDKQLYFYIDPDKIQYRSIRFLIDNNKQMLATIRIKHDQDHSTYQLYQIGRDINNNLTLIQAENWEKEEKMERKITVTFEVTELEMPLIKAYSDALVNGTIDPIEDRITDSDELRDIIKNHETSIKGLLYAVTGATMKSLSKFHNVLSSFLS